MIKNYGYYTLDFFLSEGTSCASDNAWLDYYEEEARGALQEFHNEDWQELLDNLPRKSRRWKCYFLECLTDFHDKYQMRAWQILFAEDDSELFFVLLAQLLYCNWEDFVTILDEAGLTDRTVEKAEKEFRSDYVLYYDDTKRNFRIFLEKVNAARAVKSRKSCPVPCYESFNSRLEKAEQSHPCTYHWDDYLCNDARRDLKGFSNEDWQKLFDALPGKSLSWKLIFAECLRDFYDKNHLRAWAELSAEDDSELFFVLLGQMMFYNWKDYPSVLDEAGLTDRSVEKAEKILRFDDTEHTSNFRYFLLRIN